MNWDILTKLGQKLSQYIQQFIVYTSICQRNSIGYLQTKFVPFRRELFSELFANFNSNCFQLFSLSRIVFDFGTQFA